MPFSLRRSRNKSISDEKEVVPHINDKEVVSPPEKEAVEPYTHKEVAGSDEKQVIETGGLEVVETPGKEVVSTSGKEVLYRDPPILKTYDIAVLSREHQSLQIRHGRELIYSTRRKEKKKTLLSSPGIWINIYDRNQVPQSQLDFHVAAAARILPARTSTGPDLHVCLGDPDNPLSGWTTVDPAGSSYTLTVNRRRFVLEPEFGFTLGTYRLLDQDSREALAKVRPCAASAENDDVLAAVDYYADLNRAPELLSLVAMLGLDEIMKVAASSQKEGKHGSKFGGLDPGNSMGMGGGGGGGMF